MEKSLKTSFFCDAVILASLSSSYFACGLSDTMLDLRDILDCDVCKSYFDEAMLSRIYCCCLAIVGC